MLLNSIIYITVPRLNDKDADTLNKALYYSQKAYEEALAARESSIRTETVISEFIKEQSLHNNVAENSNGESKGSNSKKKHWYTVSVMFLV